MDICRLAVANNHTFGRLPVVHTQNWSEIDGKTRTGQHKIHCVGLQPSANRVQRLYFSLRKCCYDSIKIHI